MIDWFLASQQARACQPIGQLAIHRPVAALTEAKYPISAESDSAKEEARQSEPTRIRQIGPDGKHWRLSCALAAMSSKANSIKLALSLVENCPVD